MPPASRKHRFARLRALPDYPLIRQQLLAGLSPSTLARTIQATGQCSDIKLRSLAQTLLRYRDTLKVEAQEYQRKLHEVAEIRLAILDQQHRIKVEIEKEELIGMLLPDTGNQFRILAELLKKSSELKFDLGIYQRVSSRRAA